ncbi:MAG TPA: hypothetical protein VN845_00655 [Solirubrobacteraceae bacterium]|nr:hypothetical protein [Solirubrobacteraceae bacterium]
MRQAFPDQRVEIDHLPASLDLTALTIDPGDRHICALAVAGHAELLLTFDHGYISESLAKHDIRVLTPDTFLDTTLKENPDAIMGAIQSQAEVWGGGRSIDELLNAIRRTGATVFASNARRLINM